MEKKKIYSSVLVLVIVLICMLLISACEATTELESQGEEVFPGPTPQRASITTWDVQTASYAAVATMFDVFREKEGITIRQVPQATDLGALGPIREGTVDLMARGAGSYWYAFGLNEAADPSWGPQPMRLLAQNNPKWGYLLVNNDPENIKTTADLKGRKVTWIEGSATLNVNTATQLALGGLTWDDVVKVRVPSYDDSSRAILSGAADAAFSPSTTPWVRELEISHRGLHWVKHPSPQEDPEAWENALKIFPYGTAVLTTVGAGVSEENPVWSLGAAGPVLYAYPDTDKNLAYHITRMTFEYYDDYQELNPLYLDGFSLDKVNWRFPIPWHEGAVEYFKEIGVWDEEKETHNNLWIERQEYVLKMWEEAIDEYADKKMAAKEFQPFWESKVHEYMDTWDY